MLKYSQEAIDELVQVIYEKIKKKFDEELNEANVEFSKSGIVVTPKNNNDGTKTLSASVDLGFVTLEDVSNSSGELLKKDDKVRVFYDKRTMKNAYIGVKF